MDLSSSSTEHMSRTRLVFTSHQLFVLQVTGILRPGELRRVLCEGSDLDRYIQFGSQAEKETFQNVSCSLTPQQLIDAQRMFLQNLDARKVLSEVRRYSV